MKKYALIILLFASCNEERAETPATHKFKPKQKVKIYNTVGFIQSVCDSESTNTCYQVVYMAAEGRTSSKFNEYELEDYTEPAAPTQKEQVAQTIVAPRQKTASSTMSDMDMMRVKFTNTSHLLYALELEALGSVSSNIDYTPQGAYRRFHAADSVFNDELTRLSAEVKFTHR